MLELWVEFIQCFTDDYSQRGKLSGCSQELHLRGGSQYTCEVSGWEIHVVKHISWWNITTNHKEQISRINDLNIFLYMGRYKNSLKFFLRHTSNYLGSHLSKPQSVLSCFFHPGFLSGCNLFAGDCSRLQLNLCITGWWVMLFFIFPQIVLKQFWL